MVLSAIHRELERDREQLHDIIKDLSKLRTRLVSLDSKLESLVPPNRPPSPIELPRIALSARDTIKSLISALGSLDVVYSRYETRMVQAAGLPTEVTTDINEAVRCFGTEAKAYRAAVTMLRRALENVCHGIGAEGRNLQDKIERLPIDRSLKSLAHGLREFGNYGAHPQNDVLREVTKERADEILGIGIEILNQIYYPASRQSKTEAVPSDNN